jgi:hypothetical protein
MKSLLPAFAVALLSASCTVAAPPPSPTPAQVAGDADMWPCRGATKANLTPDCFAPNADQHRRIGASCDLHRGYRLLADTVAIHYGFVGTAKSGKLPGLFTNSRLEVSGGCVVGKPFTEVAYCPECRRVRGEFEAAHR